VTEAEKEACQATRAISTLLPVPWTEKKKQLKCRHFSSDTEVIATAETWLDGQSSDFLSGLQRLEQRAKKCIELRGEYRVWSL
jgi:hypothetical protein